MLKLLCDVQGLPEREDRDAWPDHQKWPGWSLLGREGENKAAQKQVYKPPNGQREASPIPFSFQLIFISLFDFAGCK